MQEFHVLHLIFSYLGIMLLLKLRNLLKYCYWRTTPPQRDWLVDPEFDPARADYTLHSPTFRQQFRDCFDAAEMFYWLSGKSDEFRLIGGQGWPIPANFMDQPYGFPPGVVKGQGKAGER